MTLINDADKPDADTTASEDGAEATEGGDWAAEDEGEEPKQEEEEEEEESEEAREARLAEYAAAKAEEDAIKQVHSFSVFPSGLCR